jgi:hypothetical protein
MRLRLRQLFDQTCLSFTGTNQRVGDKALLLLPRQKMESLTPPCIPRNPAYVDDVAPIHLWDTDILADGYNRFMSNVRRIKAQGV